MPSPVTIRPPVMRQPKLACVFVGVGVAGGVFVGVSVRVLVGVFVGVSVGVLVGVLVGVFVGVSVGVFVGVSVGVSVGVFVFVGVGVGADTASVFDVVQLAVFCRVPARKVPFVCPGWWTVAP